MNDVISWLPLLFFVIAFTYSSVGFAGGSSYLAVLLLAGLPYAEIKPIALVCNLVVSSVGFWNFSRAGHFDAKKVLPFAALSVPMAFMGAQVPIGKEVFTILLGFSLALAGLRIFFLRKNKIEPRSLTVKQSWAYGLPIGAILGFFSGMIGIGGGIFLCPILILMRWATVKEASAAAAFFIFVNSLSGLLGRLPSGISFGPDIMALGAAAFLGGALGSVLGARRLPEIKSRVVLGSLMLYGAFTMISQVF